MSPNELQVSIEILPNEENTCVSRLIDWGGTGNLLAVQSADLLIPNRKPDAVVNVSFKESGSESQLAMVAASVPAALEL